MHLNVETASGRNMFSVSEEFELVTGAIYEVFAHARTPGYRLAEELGFLIN